MSEQASSRRAPYAYLTALLAQAQRLGVDASAVLHDFDTELGTTQDGEPPASVDSALVGALIRHLWRETGDELMGFCSGPLHSGTWALSTDYMIAADTLGELLRRGEYFHAVVSPDRMFICLEEADGQTRLEIHTSVEDRDPETFLAAFLTVLWHRFPSWAVDQRIALSAVEFATQPPPDAQMHRVLFDCEIRYGAPAHALVMPTSQLALPVVRGKRALALWLRDSPADLLYMPGRDATIAGRIRQTLLAGVRNGMLFPTLTEASRDLHLSEQAVRRRLAEEHTSFQRIKDRIRLDRAVDLLATGDLPIAEIAQRVGFSEPAAFTRAFRRWTGHSPSDYRAILASNRSPPGA